MCEFGFTKSAETLLDTHWVLYKYDLEYKKLMSSILILCGQE